MTELLADRPRVSDLRGTPAAAPAAAVLEDPTGRRRRRLKLLARLVAVVLTAWLVALVLGGVGLSPVPGIPFAHVLGPATPPPAAKKLPTPAQPSASDLKPARPASKSTAVAERLRAVASPAPLAPRRTSGGHVTAPQRLAIRRHVAAVHTPPSTVGTAPAAPAPTTTTTHPNNGRHAGSGTTTTTTSGTTTTTTSTGTTTAPGRSDTAPGKAGTAPGRERTVSATP